MPGAPLIVHERVALYRHHDFAPENTISCNDIRLIKSLVLRGGVTCCSTCWTRSSGQLASRCAVRCCDR